MAITPILTTGVKSVAKDGLDLTSTGFTVSVGDKILVKQMTADASGFTINTPTCTIGGSAGPTFTRLGSAVDGGATFAHLDLWQVTANAAGSMVVTVKGTGGSARAQGALIEQWASTCAFAQLTPSAVTGTTTAPSATVTTSNNGSAVTWMLCDTSVNAVAGTYRSSATEEYATGGVASEYVGWFAYQDAAAAGSQTVGMTAPTQKWTLAAVEVTDSAASFAGTVTRTRTVVIG